MRPLVRRLSPTARPHHPAPDRDHLEVHLARHRVDEGARRREEVRAVVQPVVADAARERTRPPSRSDASSRTDVTVAQSPRRGQPGDAAADDDHVVAFDGSRSSVHPGLHLRAAIVRGRSPRPTRPPGDTASNIGDGQPAGERVLLARVVRPDEPYGPTSRDTPCPNRGLGAPGGPGSQRPQRRVPAERAERQDHPKLGQQRDLPGEERRAGVALVVRGLVERRRAPDGGRDVGIGERQAIVRAAR